MCVPTIAQHNENPFLQTPCPTSHLLGLPQSKRRRNTTSWLISRFRISAARNLALSYVPLLHFVVGLLVVQIRGCRSASPSLLREIATPNSLKGQTGWRRRRRRRPAQVRVGIPSMRKIVQQHGFEPAIFIALSVATSIIHPLQSCFVLAL